MNDKRTHLTQHVLGNLSRPLANDTDIQAMLAAFLGNQFESIEPRENRSRSIGITGHIGLEYAAARMKPLLAQGALLDQRARGHLRLHSQGPDRTGLTGSK